MTTILDLAGKKGLVVGIANEHSIAYGCARIFHQTGAQLAITYLNDNAQPYIRPLADQLAAPIIMPCDVQNNTNHLKSGLMDNMTSIQPCITNKTYEEIHIGNSAVQRTLESDVVIRTLPPSEIGRV